MMCRLSKETVEDILRQGRIYEVGGAVRDLLLKRGEVKDRDYLVTGIPYDDLSRILESHGRVDLVGRSFGVIKFTQFRTGVPFTFDIALPRREHSTGTGHKDFAVDFDPFLRVEEDLSRRDFTINAMALSLEDEKLIDPLDGLADLRHRRLRMVSASSFVEDPLRMLRAVQFAARFQFVIEPKTFEALREHASLVRSVSSERIAEELNKLLVRAARPSEGFHLMQTTGLLKEILPELEECVGVEQPGGYHKYDVFDHTLYTVDAAKPELRLRMAALFHDITKPAHRRLDGDGATFYGHEVSGAQVARTVLTRLRYSNDFIKDVMKLVERHMFTTAVTDKGMRRLIRRVGVDLIFDLLDLRRADVQAQGMGGSTDDVDRFEIEVREELSRKPPFSYSDLALDGKDIMEMFRLSPGPVVGIIREHLLETVLDNPEFNTRDKLAQVATEFYNKHKDSVSSDNDKGSH